MRNKATLLTLLLALCVQLGYAQSRTVSGVVKDAQSGETLPGVAVLEKGTSNGTSTNFDGEFELTLTSESPVLVISAIGRESREVKVGNEDFISVNLREASESLNEVVVTALGISREKRSLGYATQEVDGEATVKAKDANFMNSLQGKVAGMQVKSSGTMGGSSNVIIRGFKSLSGNNQALFVIDGIPISNDVNNSANQRTGRGGYDFGNNAMDINPNDIESINVLKGAAATALYGSRAANGAIIITTKDGSKQAGKKGIGVSINSSASLQMIDKSTMPTYQQEYGPGYGDYYSRGYYFNSNGDSVWTGQRVELYDVDGDGVEDVVAPMGEDASFGAAFSDFDQLYTWESIYPELSTFGKPQPFEAGANDPTYFYRTALNLSNNVALSGANEQGNFRLSFTQLDQDGVLPNSNLTRYNAQFNGGWKFTDKFSVTTGVQYINTEAIGRYGTGYDNRNPNQSFRQWYNVGVDMARQEEVYDQTGLNITWNPYGYGRARPTRPHYFDNPYFVRHESFSTDERDRVIGNFVLNYKLTDWMTAVGRINMDNYSSIQEERIADGSIDVPMYRRRDDRFTETNTQFRLDMNKYFGDDNEFNFNANFGVNIRNTTSSAIISETNGGLVVPNIYGLSNSVNPIEAPIERLTEERVIGTFGRASIGYDNWLYLDVTGRVDRSSTLPEENNTYFYPSATLAVVFSEFVDSEVMDFGKFRVNFARVGNDAPALSTLDYYDLNTPFNGVALASAPVDRNNRELKPENTQSVELGLEMNFFNNRLGADLSVYQSSTFDQILRTRVSAASGSYFRYVNAGQIDNRGVEVSLFATPVRTDRFSWTTNINWSLNRNKVVELFDDSEEIVLASVQGGINITAAKGEPYGTIKGTNFVYTEYEEDENGRRVPTEDAQVVVYDHPFGGTRYRRSTSPEYIGNIQPDWNMGVGNTLDYGPFSLYFLIDIQKGGQFFSLDTWYGYATGIYDFTTGTNDKGNPVRDLPSEGGGLPLDDPHGNGLAYDDGSGVYVDNASRGDESYAYMSNYANSFGYAVSPNALHIHDASFVKLREVSLGYTVPASAFDNIFINSMNLSLYGRNLWLIHSNAPYTDPEAGLSAGNVQGYQSGAYPMVREMGLKVGLNF